MKSIQMHIDSSGLIPNELIVRYQQQLDPIIDHCSKATLETEYAFCAVPDDADGIKAVMDIVTQKTPLKPTMLIVIGIGGSNLGTMAVHQALYGSLFNASNPEMRIHYADTVDSDYTQTILHLAQQEYARGGCVLINVISKSGMTLETIALFYCFLELLKTHHAERYVDYLVITTAKESPLWQVAVKEGWSVLAIPSKLGGRFSVFSAVGLFPLAMLGVDITQLLEGARQMSKLCTKKDLTNPASRAAAWQYALCKEGYTLSNMFLFSHALGAIGSWWRQLIGESLGKAFKGDGVPNKDVIVPLVSAGTTDLHSVGQLYMAHLVPIMTTFVSVEQERDRLAIAQMQELKALNIDLHKKSMHDLMKIILKAVKKTYVQQQSPFRTVVLPARTAYCVGQFLQQMMFEVIYMADLMGVCPFDQPAVEFYKHETRELLTNE